MPIVKPIRMDKIGLKFRSAFEEPKNSQTSRKSPFKYKTSNSPSTVQIVTVIEFWNNMH